MLKKFAIARQLYDINIYALNTNGNEIIDK